MKQLKAAVAALALIGLMVGIPVVLLWVAGNPWPGLDAVLAGLTRPDYTGAFLLGTVLPVLGWIAWASFVFSVLAEIPNALAQLHGRPHPRRPRLRLLGAQQALAAALLGVVVAGIGSGAQTPALAADEAAQPHSSPGGYTAPVAPKTSTSAEQSSAAAPEPVAVEPGPEVTVAAGDTLWSLAEQHLGDGKRFQEIYELNEGRLQADGSALGVDQWLSPGWKLQLPADGTRVVVPGDTLSQIALEELGDAQAYPELAEASTQVQPDGQRLADPDLIQPGWVISLDGQQPADAAASTKAEPPRVEQKSPTGQQREAPAERDPSHGQEQAPGWTFDRAGPGAGPAAVSAEPPQESTQDHRAQPDEESADQAGPDLSGIGIPSAPQPPQAQQEEQSSVDSESVDNTPVRTVGGIGALLAAGVLSVIAGRRLSQRRRRLPGQSVPMPAGATALSEARLAEVADQATAADVDRALRFVCQWSQDRRAALPEVFCARVAAGELALYLATAADLPFPFVTTDPDRTVWTVDPAAIPPLERVPTAPWPSLTTVGQDDHGAHLLLELEYIGALSVQGEPETVAQALAAIAVELSTSPWAEELTVTLVGVAPGLAGALGTGRVREIADVDVLLTQLRGRAADTAAALASAGSTSLGQARADGPEAQGWMPEIVVIDHQLTQEQAEELTQLGAATPRLGVATVGRGPLEGPWALRLLEQDRAVIDPIGVQIIPQLITEPEQQHIIDVLDHAHQDPPEDPGHEARDELSAEQLIALRRRPAEVGSSAEDDAFATGEQGPPLATDPAPEPGSVTSGKDHSPLPMEDATAAPEQAEAGRLTENESAGPEIAPVPAQDSLSGEVDPDLEPPSSTGIEVHGAQAPEHVDDGQPTLSISSVPDENHLAHLLQLDPLPAMADAVLAELSSHEEHPSAQPLIALLGPVCLVGYRGRLPMVNGKSSAAGAARCTAVAAFLCLNPGATTEALHAAFWPNELPSGQKAGASRNKLSSQTRNLLGQDESGQPYFPQFQAETGYVIQGVRTDWELFQQLTAEGLGAASDERLHAAMRLVRGQPLQDSKPKNWLWAETLRQEMIAAVCDLTQEVCRRALLRGDVQLARRAATLGRTVDPVNEALWREAMRAEFAAGSSTGLERVIAQLMEHLEDFDEDLEPEESTAQLIEDLRRRARAAS